jgi:hypothetical protein
MRRTISAYAKQLREAKELCDRHRGVDYNNDTWIRLADQWFDATLMALTEGVDLPAKPNMPDPPRLVNKT